MVRGNWIVDLNLKKAPPNLSSEFAKIAKLPVDYAFPTRSAYGQEEFHQFSDYTRKSFGTAIRAKIRQAKN
jgi:hypothetical protein